MYISTSSKRKLAYYFHTSCNELFSWKLKTSFCFVCSLGCPTKTCFFEEENKLAKPRSYASLKLRLTDSLTYLLTGVKCRATSVAKNTLYIFLYDGRKRCTSCPKEGEGTVPQSQGDPKIVKRGPNFGQKGDPKGTLFDVKGDLKFDFFWIVHKERIC